MTFWDKKPAAFQILITILGAFFVAISLINAINIATTVTDENLYLPVGGQVYLAGNIRAALKEEKPLRFNDTIYAGSLILAVDEKKVRTKTQIREALDSSDKNHVLVATLRLSRIKGNSLPRDTFFVRKGDMEFAKMRSTKGAAIVNYIFEGGISERAGMKVGDFIVKINGEEIVDATKTGEMLRNQKSGSIIEYEIWRGSEIINIPLKLVKYGVSFAFLMVFITGYFLYGIGLFFGLKRPRLKAARITSISLLVFGLLMSFGMLSGFGGFDAISVMRIVAALFGMTIGFPLLIHSLMYFPMENELFIRKKLILRSYYITGALTFVYSLITVLLIRDYFFNPILIIVPSVYILAYIILLSANRNKFPTEFSKVTRPIHFILTLNFGLFALLSLLRIFSWDIVSQKTLEYMFSATLLIPLSYLYTAGRYRLLDLDIRVRRNIQYSFVSFAWNLFLIVLLGGFIWFLSWLDITIPNIHFSGTAVEVLENPLDPARENLYEKILIGILSLGFGALLLKVRRKAQKFLDRKFYRVQFDYRRASRELSDIMETKLSIGGLAEGIVEKLGSLVHLKHVGIMFFKDEEFVAGQDYYGFRKSVLKEFCSFAGRDIVDAIKPFNKAFSVDYLPQNIKSVFRECKFLYVMPIRSKGKVVGALLIGEKLSEAAIHDQDLEFLASIAGQAAVAIENSFLYEDLAIQERYKHELEIARRIQMASLPQDIPEISGMDISGISLPALEVGGDFYDIINGHPSGLTIVVGDVSGKGTSAALYMSKAQGIIRTLHEFDLSPHDLFVRTNQLLYKYLEKSYFITAIGAHFDIESRKAKVARAGHIPLFILRKATGKIETIKPTGVIIGMTKDDLFDRNLEEIEVGFEQGDVFLFLTDGILEARNGAGEDFGEERLLRIFKNAGSSGAKETRDKIVESAQEFGGNTDQFDDITVVVAIPG